MKSYIANTFDPANKQFYSDLGVYESGAGFYIGTMYYDPADGFPQPGTRDSMEYYPTREDAETAFKFNSWTQRKNP
jgi:hypothetical protein